MNYHNVMEFSFYNNERTDFGDFNCHFWQGNTFASHSHSDYYEIMLVTSGDYVEKINGVAFPRKRGDIIILKPFIDHSVVSASNDARMFNIAVRSTLFEQFIISKENLKLYLLQNESFYHHLDDTSHSFCVQLIQNINVNDYDYISYSLTETLVTVLLSLSMLSLSKHQMDLSPVAKYCIDAINKINDCTLINVNLSNLYALYPVSHTAFIAQFKKITTLTPLQYLTKKRMELGKRLLLTTTLSVLDISLQLGYDSPSHFIKLFKKEYGITPYSLKKTNSNIKNPKKT